MCKRLSFITIIWLATANLSFSQFLLKEERHFLKQKEEEASYRLHFNEIISTINCKANFMITTNLGNEIYIVMGLRDLLLIITYLIDIHDRIGEAYLISSGGDTSFISTVYSLASDIKKNNQYTPYSSTKFFHKNSYLAFCIRNNIQVFCENLTTESQLKSLGSILDTLNNYMIMPYNRPNEHIKEELKINNFNELILYLKKLNPS